MVRDEAEVSASVGVFSVDFGVMCRLFPDDQNIKMALSDYFHGKLDGRP
jgi:hypothetical protein